MFLSREQVREVDRRAIEDYGIPGVVLLENAGRGSAELLRALGIHGRVAICCGKGNNGGDGFVIARYLDNWGIRVRILLFARPEELTGEAAINYHIITRSGLLVDVHAGDAVELQRLKRELAGAEWVVDALFGTGLSGPLRSPFDRIVETINDSPAKKLAVDIPSGLDADTGQPLGATVRASHTATFVALKKGFANAAARAWLGLVHVIDIGTPARIVEEVVDPGPIGGST